MSALVIEDDPTTGAALCALLRKNGWRAEWACDLINAEAKVAAFDPDLLLVDLHVRDGDVPSWLRAWSAGRRLVFLTAADRDEASAVASQFPGAQLILKPASDEEIIAVLSKGRVAAEGNPNAEGQD